MTDGFQLLEHDHRAVEELFESYEQSGDEATANQICLELAVHGEVEEQALYPRLRDFGDKTSELAANAETAHELVDNFVGRIRLAASDERLPLVRELREAVDRHIRDEETEIFPAMRDLGVDPGELGRALEAAKGEAIARSRGSVG